MRMLEIQNEMISKQLEEGNQTLPQSSESEDKIEILNETIRSAEERNQKLLDQIKELESEIVGHKAAQELHEQDIRKYTDIIKEKDSEIELLTTKVTNIDSQQASLRAQVKDGLDQLQKEKEKTSKVESELRSANDECEDLIKSSNQKQDKIKSQASEIQKNLETYKQQKDVISELMQAKKKLQEKVDSFEETQQLVVN